MGLVQFGSVDTLDQIGVGDLRAEAQHGRCDLSIEKRFGNLAGVEREEIKILTACMDHFFNLRIANQIPKWCERAVGLYGGEINDSSNLWAGDLDEFKLRNEAVFANELRVERQPRARP